MNAYSEQPHKGGFLGNLAFNILIPVVILTKFSGPEDLGPIWSIIIALSFPIGYGLWDLKQSGKVNAFSILGIVSVFLTGGISLLELDPKYIAIKEAAIPAIIGIAVLLTQNTKYSLLKLLILNDQIIKTDKLAAILEAHQATEAFNNILRRATYIVVGSFALSSVLNYLLAKYIVVSPPGTTAFSEELGELTAWSYPVIAIPSMIVMLTAIWYLFNRIGKLTGMGIEHFMHGMEEHIEQPEK